MQNTGLFKRVRAITNAAVQYFIEQQCKHLLIIKVTTMLFNRMPTGKLLLAGLAAYAYYKYSKMSQQEKKDLFGNLKQKGQKLYEDYVPSDVRDRFGKTSASGAESRFGEGNAYTG